MDLKKFKPIAIALAVLAVAVGAEFYQPAQKVGCLALDALKVENEQCVKQVEDDNAGTEVAE